MRHFSFDVICHLSFDRQASWQRSGVVRQEDQLTFLWKKAPFLAKFRTKKWRSSILRHLHFATVAQRFRCGG
jgi:hypothetical protein